MAAFPCRDSWLRTKAIPLGRRPERRPVKESEGEAAREPRCAREKRKEPATDWSLSANPAAGPWKPPKDQGDCSAPFRQGGTGDTRVLA